MSIIEVMKISREEILEVEERSNYLGGYYHYDGSYEEKVEIRRRVITLKEVSRYPKEKVYKVDVAGEYEIIGYLDSSGKRIVEY